MRTLSLPLLLACLRPCLAGQQAEPGTEMQEFRVVVEDHQGRPVADVPVVLGQDCGDEFGFSALKAAREARTGPDGVAVLACARSVPRTHLAAEAQVLAEPPVRVGLHARVSPPSPHVLRLPPTGQVRVLCYGEDEHPLPGVTGVDLAITGNRRFFDRVRPDGTLQREGALFRHVQTGLQVTARASLQGTHGALMEQRAGPARPGELVVVDLRLNTAQLLTMRLLGTDGLPAADALLTGLLGANESCTEVALSTRADGTLHYLLPAQVAGEPNAELRLARRGSGPVTEYLGGIRIPLPHAWRGVRNLGLLQMQEEGPIVQGRLVDADGLPMPGVLLSADATALQAAVGSHSSGRAFHRVRTDAQGCFTFREFAPLAVDLQVTAEGGVFLPEGTVVRVGETKAVLAAARGGSAFVEMPGLGAGTAVRFVDLQRCERQPGMHRGFPPSLVAKANGIEFSGLPPGTYDLLLGTSGVGTPVQRIDGLEIRPGERCADPRLRIADWQQHLRPVHWTVEGPLELQAEAQITVCHVTEQGFSRFGLGRLVGAPRTLLVPRGRKLAVWGPACSTVVLDDPSGDVKFELRPRPEVRLSLPAGLVLPPNLRLCLSALTRPWSDNAVVVTTTGKASFSVRPDGSGAFATSLKAPRGDGGYDEVWTGVLDVPEGPSPHTLELRIDAATTEALCKRFAPKHRPH